MKKLLFLSIILPFLSKSQDCKNYYYMTNNATVVMTVYDKKGKENGTQTWKVSNVRKSGNAWTSQVNTSFKDDKGKEISNSAGSYVCDNGILKADVRMSLPQQQMEAYKDADAKLDAAYIEYPAKMNVGDALSDADFKMEVNSKGLATNISFKEVNRKVEKKESVTTSAGTWDAFVITFNATFRTQVAGIGIPFNMEGKEWFVPGVGIVKTETYSKGGKLIGSTALTSITK